MKKNKVLNIINEVYPLISKDYSCNAKVELHYNIYERLSGEKGMYGTACAQAEYDWSENKIYLYTSRLFNEEDVIRSLIHECVHSNQNKELFDAYYFIGLDYDTNPYEIEAEYEESNWKKYKLNTNNIG